jgi:hypothetical protein
MRPARRLLAIAVLVAGAVASMATSQSAAPPGATDTTADTLVFGEDQATELRHLTVKVTTGKGVKQRVWGELVFPDSGNEPPVSYTITDDVDGSVVLRGPDPQALTGFNAIPSCKPRATCSRTYTFWFKRNPEDRRPTLELDWLLTMTPMMLDGSSRADLSVMLTR